MQNSPHIWKEHPSNYKYLYHIGLLRHTESRAHLVNYSCLCGKLMVVYSAVVSKADIVPLTQNFSNWSTDNSHFTGH